MRDKRRFALCIVGTLMAMALLSTSAAMAADEILSPISEQISGTVVVLTEKAEHPAQLVSTGKLLEGDDNKIYEEFELRDDSGNTISLSPDNIERITVKRQGDQLSKNLNPEGDTLYWDVLTQSGIYHFTFETKVEIYRAELDWTPLNLINLTWDLPENLTTLVQRSEQICIQAALTDKINSAGIQQIAGVVYVFEITKV
jgi:hypothetical protein